MRRHRAVVPHRTRSCHIHDELLLPVVRVVEWAGEEAIAGGGDTGAGEGGLDNVVARVEVEDYGVADGRGDGLRREVQAGFADVDGVDFGCCEGGEEKGAEAVHGDWWGAGGGQLD